MIVQNTINGGRNNYENNRKRAEEYANNIIIGYERKLWLYNTQEEIKKVFIDATKEQKQIDIDKACDWLKVAT